jgi:hypothetical protein
VPGGRRARHRAEADRTRLREACAIWYAYEPGGDVRFVTARGSRKGELIAQATRLSLCAQTETPPYKYVSVEGPIVDRDASDIERDLRSLARRYLGPKGGDEYIESTRTEHSDKCSSPS